MKLVDIYALFVNNCIEKSRNSLFKHMLKSNKKKDELIKKYDKLLLDSYIHIEQLLDEQKDN